MPDPDKNPDSNDTFILSPGGGLPRLLAIMRRLRDPETGCPWDIEQDFASIAPYTIEEAYEVADAIERKDWPELKAELGDLLLQVVYHAEIGVERGLFDFHAIADAIAEKMVARHPHVFGSETREKTAEQQSRDWEAVKAAERAARAKRGVLDGVARNLPALARAVKLQKRAARVGFDWNDPQAVLEKLAEETAELVEACERRSAEQMEEEMGDLLFVMANLARHLKVDPEQALRRSNSKFERRFREIEKSLEASGKSIETATLEEMDAIWNAVRARDKKS